MAREDMIQVHSIPYIASLNIVLGHISTLTNTLAKFRHV